MAVEDDAPDIARVQVESWRTTYAGIVPDAYLAAMDADQRAARWREIFAGGERLAFVAEDESGVFGFVSGGKLREAMDGYDGGELFALYLLRENQGIGAGRCLFAELARSLHASRYSMMALWVLRRNPAVRFYEHMGGIEIATKTIEIGGTELEEVAYGFKLSSFLTKQPVAEESSASG
jgi:GNAT superfamily N-acetyltransferase